MAVLQDGQFIVLLDIEKSTEEFTLEDIDDSVQRLLQLMVLLCRTPLAPTLVLFSLVQFDSVLLEQLQGPLSIFLSHRHGDRRSPTARVAVSDFVCALLRTDACVCPAAAFLQTGTPNRLHNSPATIVRLKGNKINSVKINTEAVKTLTLNKQ